jgi:predicted O-linked N-acetylglucosamine transferase (SPINDLY family)
MKKKYAEVEPQLLADADRFFDIKDYVQALIVYEKVLSHNSDGIEAKTGQALCLVHLGNYSEAVPYLLDLLKYLPESEALKLVLAGALSKSGRNTEAVAYLAELIATFPDNIEALASLGRIQMEQGEYPQANECLKKVLLLNPDHIEALSCMGLMLIKFCQFDDALKALQKAHALAPNDALILNNLGRASKMIGHHQDALYWYRLALDAEPGNTCIVSNYLFALNYVEGLEPAFIAHEHFRLAPRFYAFDLVNDPHVNSPCVHERLRIGYVSADLYTHSVSYFLEPILQCHDHSRFEIFCYSIGSIKDATTERLMSLVDNWRDLKAVDPETLAKVIRKDQIDVLVDLAGHTGNNRLSTFAASAAPVQVSWIGYPNTSGLTQMDYYLTDAICDPPGMTEQLYSERLWLLPRAFCCYLPPIQFPPVMPLPCVTNGHITFGSFNNFAKVTPTMIGLWAQLLHAVPSSSLYLKSMPLGERQVTETLLAAFAAEGISEDRIETRTVTSTPLEHLEEYSRVDIALDTYPYNGTTTTCEALWMGTPVVSWAGTTHVARIGAMLLHQVGCSDLIAEDADSYVARAISLAHSRTRLANLREHLRGMMARSVLMDYSGITCEVEEAFSMMYEAKVKQGTAAYD